jgi:HAD superfamily hydrolase (TIGR01509 family)
MNNWRPAAVIFDMDGLLVDSEIVWEAAENVMLAARGHRYEAHQRSQLIGLRTEEFLGRLRQMFDLPESIETLNAEVMTYMLELIPQQVVAKPGAPELLAYVRQQRLPCAIASASPVKVIEAIVASQDWNAVLPVRCSADEVARGKPWPDVYLEGARRLGVHPSDCLALEDSPNGARAAVAAGMVCFAVPDLSHTRVSAFAGITEHVYVDLHAVHAHLIQLLG